MKVSIEGQRIEVSSSRVKDIVITWATSHAGLRSEDYPMAHVEPDKYGGFIVTLIKKCS